MLASAVLLACSAHADAACNGGATVTGSLTISSSCDGGGTSPLSLDGSASVLIDPGVTVSNNAFSGRNGDPIHILDTAGSASLNNQGTVYTASQWGVVNFGIMSSLLNSGTIESGVRYAVLNSPGGYPVASPSAMIDTLTNIGRISGPFSDISNSGSIRVLNNLQGAAASDPLTYRGTLPSNYNVIIRSPSDYGQLVQNSATGTMAFGIYGGGVAGVAPSVVSAGTYAGVLQGFTTLSGISGTTGSYGGYDYSLVADPAHAGFWSLVFVLAGPSVSDTNASTAALSSQLQTPFALQTAKLDDDLGNDCSLFDRHGVCVGAAGRYAAVGNDGPHEADTLVYGAYQIDEHVRIGAWADQGLSAQAQLQSIRYGDTNPMVGAFAVWTPHPEHDGVSLRVAAGYGSQGLTLSRAVVGSSEPGSGSTDLRVQGADAEVRYEHQLPRSWTAAPYLGLRYIQATLQGYSEQGGANVTDPLSYGKLSERFTTVRAGLRFAGHVDSRLVAGASVGIEQDVSDSGGSAAVSSAGIGPLDPMSMNTDLNRTRPAASVGLSYDVDRAQRIGIVAAYGQQPFENAGVTTARISYTAGF